MSSTAAIQPVPQFAIFVANPSCPEGWTKKLEEEEFHQVREMIKEGPNGLHMFDAIWYTVRTNTIVNFAKDFFLPTFINHAIKAQNTAFKIFAILASLAMDIITFPIRIVKTMINICTKKMLKEHPFHKYLKEQGANEELLNSEYVRLKYCWYIPSQKEKTTWYTAPDGKRYLRPEYQVGYKTWRVNFIEIPQPAYSDDPHYLSLKHYASSAAHKGLVEGPPLYPPKTTQQWQLFKSSS